MMEFWVLDNVFAPKASEEAPVISVLEVILAPTAQVAENNHLLSLENSQEELAALCLILTHLVPK